MSVFMLENGTSTSLVLAISLKNTCLNMKNLPLLRDQLSRIGLYSDIIDLTERTHYPMDN